MDLDPDPDPDPDPGAQSPLPSPASAHPATGGDLADLVIAARNGDRTAWSALIKRCTPLVFSIILRYRLSRSDAEDVSQMVWLRMFENLTRLREPRALPGWLRTTTNNEAMRVIALARRAEPMDPAVLARLDAPDVDETGLDRDLLRLERERAVVAGLAELTAAHRQLLILLHAEPKASYQDISRELGMPPGSIGPTRARCLKKLRGTNAVQTFLRSEGGQEWSAAA